jgi:glutamate carboxypeptidase
MALSAREAELLGWLASQYDAMVELLGRLVDTDSGSYDQDGVARAGALIQGHLARRGIPCEEIVQADGSFSLRAVVRPPQPVADNAHVLLLGHRDTVFPRGTVAERPFRVEGDRAYGPGVADMKGRSRDECVRARGLRPMRRRSAARGRSDIPMHPRVTW